MASPPTDEEVKTFTGTEGEARVFLGEKLFEPSLERIKAVTRNMMTLTGSGDWAFWLPFAAIQSMLVELRWGQSPFPESARLLSFMTKGMRILADRCETYIADLRRGGTAGFPVWTEELTAAIQAEVLAEFPLSPTESVSVADLPVDATDGEVARATGVDPREDQ